MVELKEGDIVEIYQKPITKDDFEGKAKLKNKIRPDVGDGLEIWEVEFWDERGTSYYRTIFKDQESQND